MPIVGNPTDNDLTAIHEILMPVLLGVPYNTAGPHNLVSLIMPKAAYRLAYSVAFKYPARPELYDDNIANNATPVVRATWKPPTRICAWTTSATIRPNGQLSNPSKTSLTRHGTRI